MTEEDSIMGSAAEEHARRKERQAKAAKENEERRRIAGAALLEFSETPGGKQFMQWLERTCENRRYGYVPDDLNLRYWSGKRDVWGQVSFLLARACDDKKNFYKLTLTGKE